MKTKKVFLAIATIGLFAITSCQTSTTAEVKDESVAPEVTEMIEAPLDLEIPIVSEVLQAVNIIEVAQGNENFSVLVAALKAANLVETLSGEGPFTVFAPNNKAFTMLPEGTLESLLLPENLETLKSILTYHVVAGKFDASAILEAIESNNGTFEISTIQGGTLVASLDGGNVILKDVKGNTSKVLVADIAASNGVIHSINNVVMPK